MPRLLRHVAALQQPASTGAAPFRCSRNGWKATSGSGRLWRTVECVHSRASKVRRILSKSAARKGTAKRGVLPSAMLRKRLVPRGRNRPRGGLPSPASPTSCPIGWPRSPGASRRSGAASSRGPSRPRRSTRPRLAGSSAPRLSRASRCLPTRRSRSLVALGLIERLAAPARHAARFLRLPGRGLLRSGAPAVLRRRGSRGSSPEGDSRGSRAEPHLLPRADARPAGRDTCGWPIGSRPSGRTATAASRSSASSRARPPS